MIEEIDQAYQHHITRLRNRAFAHSMRIVLTDTSDERVLDATRILAEEARLRPVLVGQTAAILPSLQRRGIENNIDVYDPDQDERQVSLENLLRDRFEARGKALPLPATLSMMAKQPLLCGMLLVQANLADGLVGGAAVPTAEVIRAGIQVAGIDPAHSVISGAFVMFLSERLPAGQDTLVLGDAAVIPNPSAEQLASIAVNTAQIARDIMEKEPVVALLSFSTHGSAEDSSVSKVRDALQLIRRREPLLRVDGELQADAALVPEISARKAPGNTVQGKANVLIFPNLDASNIAYKLLERISRATALGVILSGLAKPINDLSRGCSTDDIVNMVAVTALQAVQKQQQARIHESMPTF